MYLKQFRTGFQKSISSQNPVIYKSIKKNARNYKIYGNSTQSILPVEYQQVEWLESTATQHIDTGFKPNNNSGYEIKVDIKEYNTNYNAFCGSRNAGIEQFYSAIQTDSPTQTFFFRYNTDTRMSTSGTKLGINTIRQYKNTNSVNGIAISNFSQSTFQSLNNMYVFAVNNNGNASGANSRFLGRVYYCKIWDNDVLIRNLIPCKRISDNVAGMYDTVNNVFYTNAGTGTFILGPVTPTIDTPSEIKSVGDKTANLFNKSTAVDGFILTSNGTVATTSYNNKATDYILVTQDNVTISGHNYTQPNVATVGLAWYDINKAFISSVAFTSSKGNGTYTKPANAVYCRYTVNTTDINTSQFEVGTSATAYVPYGYKIEVVSRAKNLVSANISDWENGQYNLSGAKDSYGYRIKLKELTKVKPNTTYYINNYKVNSPSIVFVIRAYDKNKTFISSYGNVSNNTTILTPSNCYYIGVSLGCIIADAYPSSTYFDWLTDKSLVPYIVENALKTPFEPYTTPITTTYYLNEPLRAIETTSSNYNVVANGKYYISDYIDKANGKVVRNVGQTVVDGTINKFYIANTSTTGYNRFTASCNFIKSDKDQAIYKCFCSHTNLINNGQTYYLKNGFTINNNLIYFYDSSLYNYTLTQINDWAIAQNNAGTPFTVIGLLPTPTEESITAQNLEIKEDTTIIESKNEVQPLLYAIDYNSKTNKN